MTQHKLIFLVPSDKRLDLEKMVMELMEGIEGFQHLGSYLHDPNKPTFRTVYRDREPKSNGHETSHKRQTGVEILELMRREPRPFTAFELSQRLKMSASAATQALKHLSDNGVVKLVMRGLYKVT